MAAVPNVANMNPEGEGTADNEQGPQTDTPAKPQTQAKAEAKPAKRSSLTDKAKAGFASFQNKFKSADNANAQQGNANDNEQAKAKGKESRLSMAGLLKQARVSLEKWIDIEKPDCYPMPKGIVFLTSMKGSFGWGAEVGTGLVLYRLDDAASRERKRKRQNANANENDIAKADDGDEGKDGGDKPNEDNKAERKDDDKKDDGKAEWSGPCAIGSGGISFGFQIGVSKVDHIIMLPRRHHVRTFTSKGQLKLGGSSELTVVNVGGKAQGSVNIGDKEMSEIHSYSLDTKGLSIGVSVEGAVISVRGDCNDSFYGSKNTTADAIADGKVDIPENDDHTQNEDYTRIVELLNKHFKVYIPVPHVGPPGPHGPGPLAAGVAIGVVGALAHGPRGGFGRGRGGFGRGRGGFGRGGPGPH